MSEACRAGPSPPLCQRADRKPRAPLLEKGCQPPLSAGGSRGSRTVVPGDRPVVELGNERAGLPDVPDRRDRLGVRPAAHDHYDAGGDRDGGSAPPRCLSAFYSSRPEQTGSEVISDHAERWSIEEAIQGGKSHLGFEQPQGWRRRAVQRTAPVALLLCSLIVLWFAQHGHRLYQPLVRPWYSKKARPSFADMLRTLQQESLVHSISKTPHPDQLLQNLTSGLIPGVKLAA